MEYLNRGFLGGSAEARLDSDTWNASFGALQSRAASEQGSFSLKVHDYQLHELLGRLDPASQRPGRLDWLGHFASSPSRIRWIRLRRQDTLRQAISLVRAMQSNRWWLPEEGVRRLDQFAQYDPGAARSQMTETYGPPWRPERLSDGFHFGTIDRVRRRLEAGNMFWDAFFDASGVEPVALSYEQLSADPAGETQALLQRLRLRPAARPVERLLRQRDATTDEWVHRYLVERRRLAS
jgi:LPS sulfotransferase NodH